jgi:hypothetical protein
MKTFLFMGKHDPDEVAEIVVNEGEMIVYDVVKVKDYEGGDYVPRKAREMDHVVLPIGQWPEDREEE